MKTKPTAPPPTVPNPKGKPLETHIGEQVLLGLGRPESLRRMQVRKLWDGRYRANIFIGPDGISATLAHSFFLLTDEQGKILQSTPEITRHY